MKGKIIELFMLICFCIAFSLSGCANNSQNSEMSGTESSNSKTENSSAQKSDESSSTENDKTPTNSEISDVAENVRAIITINGKEYGMTITDTTVGHAFAKKLRDEGVYTVTGYRSTDDLCCSESESLETNSAENMPWECGGVAWTGSWFTIWVSENAADHDMPVIAKIDEEYLKELQSLSGNMEIEVRFATE
ncbi:MAG: hypothetical protein J1F03_10720 [Oscillospiraceae bacterium]|nr:hypothetical protein [Oscillospiraceae bacterium]